mmetsp:Transcript_98869/g.313838  ORF Transcript_98869/g.313838 Transcript_98869/m.313838 type:complete len:215 (+) Transcript_98869:159-803(+)
MPAAAVPTAVDVELPVYAKAPREAPPSPRHRWDIGPPALNAGVKTLDRGKALRLVAATSQRPDATLRAKAGHTARACMRKGRRRPPAAQEALAAGGVSPLDGVLVAVAAGVATDCEDSSRRGGAGACGAARPTQRRGRTPLRGLGTVCQDLHRREGLCCREHAAAPANGQNCLRGSHDAGTRPGALKSWQRLRHGLALQDRTHVDRLCGRRGTF